METNAASAPGAQKTSGTPSESDFRELSRTRRIVNSAGHVGWEPLSTSSYLVDSSKLIPLDDFGKPISAESHLKGSAPLQVPELRGHLYPLEYGEIPILHELECKLSVQRIFKRGNRYILLQAFDFGTPLGANAGYNYLRNGSTNVVKKGDGSSEDSESISFWQDNYFFRLIATSKEDDESKEVMTDLADQLSRLVGSHASLPPMLSSLPVIDRVKGSEKIVLGPKLASRYLTIPFLYELQIENSKGAALADYQMFNPHRERLKLLCVKFDDPKKAFKVFEKYFNSLRNLHKPAKLEVGPPPQFLFKLNKTFLFCELKGDGRLVIISGARKAVSPYLLSRQF